MPITCGSTPAAAKDLKVAKGVSPARAAPCLAMSSTAAAPSFRPLAFPAKLQGRVGLFGGERSYC
eukprot:6334732-Pyramimonas_sp.AAC.1